MHRNQLIFLLFLFIGLIPIASAEQEFLKPDQAFIISGTAASPDTVTIQWEIAEGYYQYQSKFRFETDSPGITLGQPILPEAITKNDPVFGDIQIYRGKLKIDIPIERSNSTSDLIAIKARSQGCADAGICYPPHTQTVLVALSERADGPQAVDPAAVQEMMDSISEVAGSGGGVSNDVAETTTDPLAELGALTDPLGFSEDDIIPPEQAFRFSAVVQDGQHLKLRWDIAEGTYLYQDQIKISLSGQDISLGEYQLPEPDIKVNSVKPDGSIGDIAVYHNAIDLLVPLVRGSKQAGDITLTAKFQGCADRGICYPPRKETLQLPLPAIDTINTAIAASNQTVTSPQPAEGLAEQDQIANMLKGSSTWVIIGSFFIIGLLLAFTPCVFPMIPILSGIIAGQGANITTRKAFILSLVYVLAMAATYTVAGVMAGLFGSNLQATFQNPWILSGFALLFIVLSLSMFGFYELQLPSSWQGRLSEISNKQEGGTIAGVAVMGLLSALIVGPCVAPPLAGALVYIGQTGDAVLGGLALFAMSLGMGAPLIAIGTSAGKFLPRAGAWMDAVKAVFGVMMLGIAIFMLERILPEEIAMLLWGGLLVISGIYMGALQPLQVEASGWSKLWKGLGIVLLIYGSLFFLGVAAGGKDSLQPLRGVVVGGSSATESHLNFKRIKTIDDLNQELANARAAGRPVMLDFYADWCIYCKQMEKNTFPDAAVQAALANFVLIQADVTAMDEADDALQKHVGIPAPPAMIFWEANGDEARNLRLYGYLGPADFAAHVNKVAH